MCIIYYRLSRNNQLLLYSTFGKMLSIMFKSFPDSSMPPNQWCLSSWKKPQPETSPANGASSSSLDEYGPKAMNWHPLSLPKTPYAHPQELWQFPSSARPEFLEPAYFRVFPDRHLAPQVYPDGRHGSLQHLVQEVRHQNHRLEPAAKASCSHVKTAGSTASLLNLPPSSGHCKEILTDTCKVTVLDSDLA